MTTEQVKQAVEAKDYVVIDSVEGNEINFSFIAGESGVLVVEAKGVIEYVAGESYEYSTVEDLFTAWEEGGEVWE